MTEIEIRPLAADELTEAANTVRAALLAQPASEANLEQQRASWEDCDSVAAWDGGALVGHVGAFRFRTTVPGGARVPTAGYTRVGVLPTHTRRGLLRTMMERTLREAHDRGQVLASLRASEAPIYGRYGFGLGGDEVVATITPALARPLRGPVAPGSVRVLAREEVLKVLPLLYDRCAERRVGMIDRPSWMWDYGYRDVARPSDGKDRAEVVAVHSDPAGDDDAFVFYQVGWNDGFAENPRGGGRVRELFGTSAAAERAMWSFVLDIDLITTWSLDGRPTDDPIRRALADPRAYETKMRLDEQWVRVLDVDAALTARTYGPASGSVTIEVADPLLGQNDGRWQVSAGGAMRTDAPADVSVDIATLSAAYLGGVSWRDLADSGEIAGPTDPDVLVVLDALFAVRPAPFCGTMF